MKAKEILKNVCVYLGKEELLASNIFNEDGEEPEKQDLSDLNLMLNSLNYAIYDIADYIPVCKEKEVTLVNGEVLLHDIDDNIKEIISVKTKAGRTLKYKYIENKLICLATNVVIRYMAYPKEATTIEDDVEDFGGRVSARIVAYGTASEYCLLQMLYDDASIWENRFKNAMLTAMRKKGEIKLKNRGWY